MNNEREDKRAARMFKRAELRQEQEEELALRKLNYEAKTARLVWLSSAFTVRKMAGLATDELRKQTEKETSDSPNA